MSIDEQQLYNALVNDICALENPQYNNLIIFVENFLKQRIKNWCYSDSILSGGRHYEDVMQEVLIRIIKKCEDKFFKPVGNKTEKTCDEFKAWCTTVAKHYFITYCVKEKKRKEVALTLSIDTGAKENAALAVNEVYEVQADLDEDRSHLKNCFVIVLNLKSSPHIILTWLAVSLFMIKNDTSKIKSTHLLAEKFSAMSLYEMWDIVVNLLMEFEWLNLSADQLQIQKNKLDKIHVKTGKTTGDMKYSEFYMSKGPEMSISDWINRVNSQIKKKINC